MLKSGLSRTCKRDYHGRSNYCFVLVIPGGVVKLKLFTTSVTLMFAVIIVL